MTYSDFYLKRDKKIPTLLGILIACFVGLFLLRLFTNKAVPSKAEKKVVRRLEIANISSNQATIYWQTNEKTVGWITYGVKENGLNTLAYDDRDISENKLLYLNHYITLKSLSENQTYFFRLVNDNKFEDNKNVPFSFKTAKSIKDFKGRNPAYGKIIEANGTPLENTVILFSTGNSFPLATLTKATGEWLIPLNTMYDKRTYQLITLASNDKVTIEVVGENQTSQVVTDLSKVSPLPQTIIMGQNFDFTRTDNVLSATSSRTIEAPNNEIDIVYPKENALIPGYSPLIKGVAIPNTEVIITVHSDTVFSSRVKTDYKGLWFLNLPSSLSPGEHIITIKTVDKEGNPVTVERKFTIAKNGEQVLGKATPEGTVTPAEPTVVTATPYFTPTRALTLTPPVSGGNIKIPLVGALSFIVIGIGLMLVF